MARTNVASIWTEDRVEWLKRMVARSYTCSQMAAELGNGITRNAVIGKLHRLGITGGKAAITPEERLRRVKASMRRKAEARKIKRQEYRAAHPEATQRPRTVRDPRIVLSCVEVNPMGISIYDLGPDSCRYPDGEGAEITFCGHPCLEGKSYCMPHFALTIDRSRRTTRAEGEIHRRSTRVKFNKVLLETSP